MRIKLKPSAPVHPILAKFRALPVDEKKPPFIRNLAGNYSADLLLLCEQLTENEYRDGAPLSDPQEHRVWCSIVEGAGYDLSKDFLVVPFTRNGTKASKASTAGTREFVIDLFKTGQFRACVCMGMGPFAYTFAGGRKTHARSIIGNPMFLPELGSRPVFVLPGSEFLCPAEGAWREINFAKEKLAHISAIAVKLRELLKTRIK